MKSIRIKDASRSFAMFLIAMNKRFLYEYGDFVIIDTGDVEKFKNWCLANGVRERDLNGMSFEQIHADIDVEY